MYKLYSNKIVLSKEVIKGYVVVEDDKIIDIQRDKKPDGIFFDFTDRFVLPGLINISSSTYSNELSSEYNKYFSDEKIFYQLDKTLAESGITTNFHTFNLEELLKNQSVDDAIHQLSFVKGELSHNKLIDHKIHIKFRLGDKLANYNLRKMVEEGVVDFITCTGYFNRDTFNYQNQYFVQNLQNRFDLSDEQANKTLELLINLREESALDELSYRIRSAKSRNIPFASNRFNLLRKLKDEYKIKVDIISGAHTEVTSKMIAESNLFYALDIEDIIKLDQSYDIDDLLQEKIVSIVSASTRQKDVLDYIFKMEETLGLPNAVDLFSAHPSTALGLMDRGSIEIGKKADFVVVNIKDNLPMIQTVIANGKKIIEYDYD